MLKVVFIVLLVWVAQMLFLNQAARSGFNGWDDWGMLFTYDAFNGNDLRSLPAIAQFYGSPYLWSQAYNIGIIKNLFGLNQTTIRLVELFFKSLAALSAGYMVFKISKNRTFSLLVVFFFVVFASTAGPLSHIIFTGTYLTIILMCFSILFYLRSKELVHLRSKELVYIQSKTKFKRILLASLFFFLAILANPSRAYLIVPVPLFLEVFFLIKSFKWTVFLKRLSVFYLPLFIFQVILFLNGDRPHPAFLPQLDLLSRLQQFTSGNLYTLSLPFQGISTLFFDVSFIKEILGKGALLFPSMNEDFSGFIVINLFLLILSFFLSLGFKGTKLISFIFRLMGLTIVLEAIFYLFGNLSLHNNQIIYTSVIKWLGTFSQDLNPSVFQASFGGFYFILGLLLFWEWRKHQRNNKVLKVTFFAWLWSIISEVLLYLTSHWMPNHPIDRYIITISLGAVIFTAGIFTLCIQAVSRVKKFHLKVFVSLLIGISIVLIALENYQLSDSYFYIWNENLGKGADWQDTIYQRFLNKFGKENLAKSSLVYIETSADPAFSDGSFVGPARFRLFYDGNGKLIRDNCKSVTSDINILKRSFVIQNEKKGFLVEGICLNPSISYQTAFYPLDNFYAYKMQDKEFINIREKTLDQMEVEIKPSVSSPTVNGTGKKIIVKGKGINPDSFYYPLKRIWEKFFSLMFVVMPQSKINYEKALLNDRLSELNYVSENRLLSKVEDSSKRFAYQAGVLTSHLIKQNKAQDKNNLIGKFDGDMKLLEKFRDYFPANSSYWLFIQHDINTLKILSDQLK